MELSNFLTANAERITRDCTEDPHTTIPILIEYIRLQQECIRLQNLLIESQG